MSSIDVQILPLPHGRGLALPAQASASAAGFDVTSAEETAIEPGAVVAVATGFAIAIPHGFEGQVRPRSGLALKHSVTVLNAPGTIDADYRGEVKVILINHGATPFRIQRGDRIAQLVFAPVTTARFETVSALSATDRGEGGFGSTGVAARKGT